MFYYTSDRYTDAPLCVGRSALVAMLRGSVSGGAAGSAYQELLMKCIWKVVRLLPEWLSQLEFDEILLEIHKFLEVRKGWRERGGRWKLVPGRCLPKWCRGDRCDLARLERRNCTSFCPVNISSRLQEMLHDVIKSLNSSRKYCIVS